MKMNVSFRKASECLFSFEMKIFQEEENTFKFVENIKMSSEEESKIFVVKMETYDGDVLSSTVFCCHKKFSLRQNCLTKIANILINDSRKCPKQNIFDKGIISELPNILRQEIEEMNTKMLHSCHNLLQNNCSGDLNHHFLSKSTAKIV